MPRVAPVLVDSMVASSSSSGGLSRARTGDPRRITGASLGARSSPQNVSQRPSTESQTQRESLWQTGGLVGSDGSWATIVWSALDESTADLAIAEQVARFAPLGRDFEWKLYTHDRTADLGQRLVAAGFRPEPEEALLVADAAELPTEVALPEGVRLLPVTDADGVRLVVRAHEAAFATDHSSLERRLLTQLAEEPEAMAAVVAMAGDVPICAGRVEFHRGTQFASLWGGGTAPAWRGRGVYRALVAWRARLAVERGYRYLQVDALPDSAPILARLGFVRLGTTVPYIFNPTS